MVWMDKSVMFGKHWYCPLVVGRCSRQVHPHLPGGQEGICLIHHVEQRKNPAHIEKAKLVHFE